MRPLPPLVTDTSDPREIAFAERIEKDNRTLALKLWRTQLSTYEGRQFLVMVLDRLPGFEDIGWHAPADVPIVFRQLGRRSVWLELYEWINRFPELDAQMLRERNDRDRQRLREIEAERVHQGLMRRDEVT